MLAQDRNELIIQPSSTKDQKTASFWNIAAWVVWILILIVLVARPLVLSQRGTSFDTYNLAGSHWLRGENVYTQWMGFVYSPLVAALFTPLALIPVPIANIIWRLINAAAVLAGLAILLRTELFAGIKPERNGIAYLLLTPLAIANIDISQANPLVAGLLMLSISAVHWERWNWAAICVALATFFKIYPLAVGLLICVIAPGRFAWRLFSTLFLLALLPFLFQHWSYVSQQYSAWIATRTAENRGNWPVEKLPLDLWFIIRWVFRLPVPQKAFTLVQLGSATAIAAFCAVGTWKKWHRERVLVGIFCLSAIWMTLCGPATESYTYMLLASPSLLALVHSLNSSQGFWMRTLVWVSVALQFLAVTRSSFLPHFKPFWILAAFPTSAILFLCYCLAWLLNDALWTTQPRTTQDPCKTDYR